MNVFLILRVNSGLNLDKWGASSTPATLKLVERINIEHPLSS